jgi:hypothetical protein
MLRMLYALFVLYVFCIVCFQTYSQICNICVVNILLSRSWCYAVKINCKMETYEKNRNLAEYDNHILCQDRLIL